MTRHQDRRKLARNALKGLDPGFYLVHIDPKTLTGVTQLSSNEAKKITIEILGMRP